MLNQTPKFLTQPVVFLKTKLRLLYNKSEKDANTVWNNQDEKNEPYQFF